MHARLEKGLERNQTISTGVPVQDLTVCTGPDKEIAEFLQHSLQKAEFYAKNVDNIDKFRSLLKQQLDLAASTTSLNYEFTPTDGLECRKKFIELEKQASSGNAILNDLVELYNEIIYALRSKNVDLIGNKEFQHWVSRWNRF